MPRDVSGNYTLPAGINPVVANTLIDVDWANPTLADIALQLNNVFTRDGLLGPLAQFKIIDGTETFPGIAFASQINTGIFKTATLMGFSFEGDSKIDIKAAQTDFNPDGTTRLSLINDKAWFTSGVNGIFSTDGTIYTVGTTEPLVQINGAGNDGASLLISRWNTDTGGPILALAKSKGTFGVYTAVITDDTLGQIIFSGTDGDTLESGPSIRGRALSTWSNTDRFSRIDLYAIPSASITSAIVAYFGTATAFVEGLLGLNTTAEVRFQARKDSPAASPVWQASNDTAVFQGTTTSLIQNHVGTTVASTLGYDFSVASTRAVGGIRYTPSTNLMTFRTNSANQATLDANGNFVANNVVGGTYTPSGFTGTNVTAVTISDLAYMRVGNTVTVSGRTTVTFTASATRSSWTLSLPVATTFTTNAQLGGTLAPQAPSATAGNAGYCIGETTNHRVTCSVVSEQTGSTQYAIHFTYQVL